MLPHLAIGAFLAAAGECSDSLSQGKFEYDARRYREAAALFQRAVDVCVDKRQPLQALGQAQLLARQFDQSLQTFDRLLQLQPNDWSVLKLKADALYLSAREAEAVSTLETALLYAPANTQLRYALGRMLYQQDRHSDAARHFQSILEREPDNYRAHDNLALCYEALGNDPLALKHYLKALDLVYKNHPEYDTVYANAADYFLRRGDSAKAFSLAVEAAKRNNAVARNFFLAGKALTKLEKWEQSVRWLEQAAKLEPDYPEPHYLLAQVYRRLGRTEDASRELAVFQELNKRPGIRR